MKRITLPAVLTIVALGSSAGAAPASEKAVRAALTPLYGRIRTAFLNRDIDGFLRFLAPAGAVKTGEKVVDPQKVRSQVGVVFAMLKKMTGVKMEMTSVKVKGDRAVVMNRYAYQGIFEPQPGKTVKMADKGMTRDTWIKTGKGWRILNLETVESNPTMDGKSIKEAMQGSAPRSAPPRK